MPNFVEIDPSVAEIMRFLGFSRYPSAILDLFGVNMDHLLKVLGGLYHCAKCDRCISLENMEVSIFGANGWKSPIHSFKIVVWGLFDTLTECISSKAKNAHPCVSPFRLSHQT